MEWEAAVAQPDAVGAKARAGNIPCPYQRDASRRWRRGASGRQAQSWSVRRPADSRHRSSEFRARYRPINTHATPTHPRTRTHIRTYTHVHKHTRVCRNSDQSARARAYTHIHTRTRRTRTRTRTHVYRAWIITRTHSGWKRARARAHAHTHI